MLPFMGVRVTGDAFMGVRVTGDAFMSVRVTGDVFYGCEGDRCFLLWV